MLAPSKEIFARIERFFLESDLWIFGTILTMISLVMTFETEPYNILTFLIMAVGYTIVFMPTFWFIHLRPRLKARMKPRSYRGLWIFVFGLYPWLLVLMTEVFAEGVPEFMGPEKDILIGMLCVGMAFLAAATILYGLLASRWLPDVRKRIGRHLNPPVILTVFSILASMIVIGPHPDYDDAIRGTNDLVATGIFFGAVAQVWLIYLPYLGLFFLHDRFLYRKLLPQRGLLYYVVGGVTAMLAFAPLHGVYARLFPLTASWELHTSAFQGGALAPENFAVAGGFLIFSIPVVLFLEWFRKTRTITLLEKEKTDTELSLLKQQVNPHFFFNTLNNLYSLSLKQAPETPDTVLQLSELMRYVIYRAREERVELCEEVKYLKDYLDLQRIRLYQDADIEFTVSMENPDLKVPPLLFIILVENAFKHGIEPAVGECFLELKLTEVNGEITFTCRNSVEPAAAAKVRSGGIGLQNLHRRLELLYPDAYSVEVNQQADEYCVCLSVWGETLLTHEELTLEELVPNLEQQLL